MRNCELGGGNLRMGLTERQGWSGECGAGWRSWAWAGAGRGTEWGGGRGAGGWRGARAVQMCMCYQHCLPGSCTITCLMKNVVQLVHWKGLAQSKLVRH